MFLNANKLKNIKLSSFSLLAIYPTSYNNFPAKKKVWTLDISYLHKCIYRDALSLKNKF